MAAELIQLTTARQRIDALYKESIQPQVLAAARAIGIEGQSKKRFARPLRCEL